ncbi:MAG: ABC transporter substrate-binding protein [Spirochaetota bacterium]
MKTNIMLTVLLTVSAALAFSTGTAETTTAVERTGILVEHAGGETDVMVPAERVVALEWTYAEDLLAVGVEPVGVADVAGYQTWVNVEPGLSDDVTDVGRRQEPSLEAIAELEPDLIIGVAFRHAPIYDQLSQIAPTILFNPYPAEGDQYEEMVTTFRTIAQTVDRQEEAAAVLGQTDALFAELATQIDAAGFAGEAFALAQAFTSQGAPQIRLFTDNAMAVQIVERLGLPNAWDDGFQQYGFTTAGFEALTQLGNAHFFYVVQDQDDVFDAAAGNELWESLEFVQNGRTYALGGGTWLFGGPLSAQLLARTVADQLTSRQ